MKSSFICEISNDIGQQVAVIHVTSANFVCKWEAYDRREIFYVFQDIFKDGKKLIRNPFRFTKKPETKKTPAMAARVFSPKTKHSSENHLHN